MQEANLGARAQRELRIDSSVAQERPIERKRLRKEQDWGTPGLAYFVQIRILPQLFNPRWNCGGAMPSP